MTEQSTQIMRLFGKIECTIKSLLAEFVNLFYCKMNP